MEKLSIERRLYVSGEHKAMLDPFLPEKAEDVERLKALQQEIHQDFIGLVKRSRGARLKGPEKTLFSGEYWSGSKAVDLGLADGIGDLRTTLRTRFGDDVVTPLMAPARGWFGRLQPGVGTTDLDDLPRAADFAEEVISALETRALWARYGHHRALGGERGAPHQRRARSDEGANRSLHPQDVADAAPRCAHRRMARDVTFPTALRYSPLIPFSRMSLPQRAIS